MVGYFNADMAAINEGGRVRESLPVGADCTLSPLLPTATEPATPSSAATQDADHPVNSVVCHPDLPVFTISPAFEEPAVDSSTSVTEKVFQCSFCRKTFNQKNTYQNHLRSHGKEGEDPYQCSFCGKTFAVPARLTRHYRTHTGEKPYQCEYCKKSFSVKENLSVHRRIHTKERPYKCDICERAFEHSGKLHRHMRIHTGERPHKCAVCSKTFIQSGQLVIHMRTHTGEKPYVCKSCNKGFTCSKQLKVHNRTHTGEKPYSCDICGKSFGYNHVLKLHQVAHYGEKVYKCTICNETFTSKKTMEAHIKSHSDPAATVVRIEEAQSPELGESSCASSTSDKENLKDSDSEPQRVLTLMSAVSTSRPGFDETYTTPAPTQSHPNMRELVHYLYPRMERNTPTFVPQSSSGLNPALLAAAAAAVESENRHYSRYDDQSPSTTNSSRNSSPIHIIETSSLPVTEPSVYLIPDPLASIQKRQPYQNFQLPPPPEYLEHPVIINLPLPQSKDEDGHMLTPPSSNPVSPVPSSSPDPIDLAVLPRQVHSLPPRKRSKMILKSMETAETEMSAVRYSSVIHYARAS